MLTWFLLDARCCAITSYVGVLGRHESTRVFVVRGRLRSNCRNRSAVRTSNPRSVQSFSLGSRGGEGKWGRGGLWVGHVRQLSVALRHRVFEGVVHGRSGFHNTYNWGVWGTVCWCLNRCWSEKRIILGDYSFIIVIVINITINDTTGIFKVCQGYACAVTLGGWSIDSWWKCECLIIFFVCLVVRWRGRWSVQPDLTQDWWMGYTYHISCSGCVLNSKEKGFKKRLRWWKYEPVDTDKNWPWSDNPDKSVDQTMFFTSRKVPQDNNYQITFCPPHPG